MREVNAAIEEMRREHDPLTSHIFLSRRLYQNTSDSKSGKRHHLSARLSWQQACDWVSRGPRRVGPAFRGRSSASLKVAPAALDATFPA